MYICRNHVFFCSSSQTQASSELSDKESLVNGHLAESWKGSKSENLHAKPVKIKVRQGNTNDFKGGRKS